VDVLFVGPGDLSYALGVPGRMDDARYLEAIAAVVDACRDAACSPGVLVPDAASARRHLDLGFRFIAIASDSAFVARAAGGIVADFREATTAG